MDTHIYRKKITNPYLGGALSGSEVVEFLERYNKRGERRCYMCDKNFISPGAHIRQCKKCKNKHCQSEKNNKTIEPHEYRISRFYRGEVG